MIGHTNKQTEITTLYRYRVTHKVQEFDDELKRFTYDYSKVEFRLCLENSF